MVAIRGGGPVASSTKHPSHLILLALVLLLIWLVSILKPPIKGLLFHLFHVREKTSRCRSGFSPPRGLRGFGLRDGAQAQPSGEEERRVGEMSAQRGVLKTSTSPIRCQRAKIGFPRFTTLLANVRKLPWQGQCFKGRHTVECCEILHLRNLGMI